MKLSIPGDWNGEDWQCIALQWPDSPEYRALLMGFITYLMRGRIYDEKTGSIKDAQAVGWQIFAKNQTLPACATTDGNGHNPIPDSGSGANCGGVVYLSPDEWEIATMGSFITKLVVRNGILYAEYGECCQKPVETETADGCLKVLPLSESIGEVDVTPPEDIIPDWEPPEETPGWACRKAYALGKAWEDLLLAVNGAKNMLLPWQGANYIKSQVSYLGLGTDEAYAVWMAAQLAERTIPVTTLDWTTEQTENLICYLAARISDGSSQLLADDFVRFESAIDYATGDVIKSNLLRTVYSSVGKSNWRKAVSSGLFNDEANCDCPEQPVDLRIPVAHEWAFTFYWALNTYGFVPNTADIAHDIGNGWRANLNVWSDPGIHSDGIASSGGTFVYVRHEFSEIPTAGRLWQGMPWRIDGTGHWSYPNQSIMPPHVTYIDKVFATPAAYDTLINVEINFGQVQEIDGQLAGDLVLNKTIVAGFGHNPFDQF